MYGVLSLRSTTFTGISIQPVLKLTQMMKIAMENVLIDKATLYWLPLVDIDLLSGYTGAIKLT
jgi:hypothetical protein